MSQIRKEHKEFKQINEDLKNNITDYVMLNMVLINEKFDRTTLHRLNSSIQRFDKKFGPYRTKLPAIAKVLNDAEKGLYVVITGGAGRKSTAHMLERMTMIYNILSNFFGRDLGMLLKTPVFKTALAMPEKALNMIEHPEHNQKMIKKVLLAALKPDKVENEVFDRVYKNIPMPSLNWNEAANQIMGLCVNDLNELCGIENVPAVVVNELPSEKHEIMQEQVRAVETRPQFQAIQRAITQLLQIARENRLPNFERPIKSLSDEIVDLISDQSVATRINTFFTSAGGLIRSNDPVARILSQAVRAVQSFAIVRRTWEQNKEFFVSRVRLSGGSLENRDKEAIKQLLTRSLERGGQIAGTFGRLNPFRVESYPGLSPEEIVDAYMQIIENQISSSNNYTITYDDNGSDSGSLAKDTDTFTIGGAPITLPGAGTLVKSGHTFSGWSTSRTGARVRDPYTPTANVTLYARWTRNATAPSGGGGGSSGSNPPVGAPPPRPRP